MERRKFIRGGLVTVAATGLRAEAEQVDEFPIIDSNVSLFRWPFRRLPLDETDVMLEKMRSLGIGRAFAGSFDGVFQRNVSRVNARLAEVCEHAPELIPIGSVNPSEPGWRNDLRICVEDYTMPGIRLHPNYHGYLLTDFCFRELLEAASGAGLFVQLAASMEDRRTQNALVQVPDVDLSALPGLMREVPGVRVQLLNWKPRSADLEAMREISRLFFDTARVDGTDGIALLQDVVSADRVLFGSHAPFLIPEASLIRAMHESGLGEDRLRKIASTNAGNLAGGGK